MVPIPYNRNCVVSNGHALGQKLLEMTVESVPVSNILLKALPSIHKISMGHSAKEETQKALIPVEPNPGFPLLNFLTRLSVLNLGSNIS